MGLQIPRGDCSLAPQEAIVWEISEGGWRNHRPAMPPEASGGGGRALDAGPYPHVSERASEVQHCLHRGIFEREERHTDPSGNHESRNGLRVYISGHRAIL